MNHDTTGAKRRPTLLACERDRAEESAEPDCGPVSILSAIDTPGRTPRKRRSTRKAAAPRRGWRAAAAGVIAIAAAVAGLAYIDAQTEATWAEAPSPTSATVVAEAQRTSVAPVAPSVAASAALPEEPATQSAIIETVAALPATPKADPFATLVPPAQGEQSASATTLASAAAPATPKQTQAAAQKAGRSNAQPASAKGAKPSTSQQGQASDKKLAKAPAAKQQDPDVDLIEALVSHVAGKQPVPGRREASVTVADASSAQKSTRDVVLQQEPTLPTGELVRRCMTLGWLESQLCRARICSGQWGADPACPLSQQQSAEYRR